MKHFINEWLYVDRPLETGSKRRKIYNFSKFLINKNNKINIFFIVYLFPAVSPAWVPWSVVHDVFVVNLLFGAETKTFFLRLCLVQQFLALVSTLHQFFYHLEAYCKIKRHLLQFNDIELIIVSNNIDEKYLLH